MIHEYLPDIDQLSLWLNQYGSMTLFFLLALGIIALPVPEETLMVIAGILMSKGELHIPGTMVAAYLGSIAGITTSYIIGRTAGFYLVHKYGSWLGITEKRLEKAHNWFEHYGKWSLFIGYFIPGVRHFTGLVAGTTMLEYHYFALFAYSGALVWVSTFLGIGYFSGDYWLELLSKVEFTLDWVNMSLIIIGIVVVWGMIRYYKNRG